MLATPAVFRGTSEILLRRYMSDQDMYKHQDARVAILCRLSIDDSLGVRNFISAGLRE